jgi:hypothetical protein
MRLVPVRIHPLSALVVLLAIASGCAEPDPSAVALTSLPPKAMPVLREALAKAGKPTTKAPERVGELLREFFGTQDPETRKRIAGQIEVLPDYSPAKISDWLHGAGLFEPLQPGVQTLSVPLPGGKSRDVAIRIPRGYMPDRAWPVIYALHPSGGTGLGFVASVEATLGDAIDHFVVVAPATIRKTTLDAPGPENPENPLIWTSVRRRVHVDADRMFAMGFSLGGYAAWTNASMHADQFSGVITFSGAVLPIELPRTVEALCRNVRGHRSLNAWGANDNFGLTGIGGDGVSPVKGTIASSNVELRKHWKDWGIEVESIEEPGQGHATYPLPEESLVRVLTHRRAPCPSSVYHVFRYLTQSRAYWLEGTEWSGDQWLTHVPQSKPRPGESVDQAMDRTVMSLLGEVNGSIDRNEVKINTRHLGGVTLSLCDPLVDWERPMVVTLNGKEAYRGPVHRNLFHCLTQAAATHDFDLLRWGAIRLPVAR